MYILTIQNKTIDVDSVSLCRKSHRRKIAIIKQHTEPIAITYPNTDNTKIYVKPKNTQNDLNLGKRQLNNSHLSARAYIIVHNCRNRIQYSTEHCPLSAPEQSFSSDPVYWRGVGRKCTNTSARTEKRSDDFIVLFIPTSYRSMIKVLNSQAHRRTHSLRRCSV